jgi:hypothetical protein
LEEAASAWEAELSAHQQAIAEAEAKLADAERQSADQAQQLAESVDSVRRLEQQLEAVREAQVVLETERDEWQRLRSVATRQQAEQSQRIADLEAQIARMVAARPAVESISSPTATLPDPALPIVSQDVETQFVAPKESATDSLWETPVQSADEPRAETEWIADRAEPRLPDSPAWEPESEYEAPAVAEAMLEELQEAKRRAEFEQSPPSFESSADWSSAPAGDVAGIVDAAETADASDIWEVSPEPESQTLQLAASAEKVAVSPFEPVKTDFAESKSEVKATSYIERYAHLFADDNQPTKSPAAPASSESTGSSARKPTSLAPMLPAVATSSAADADEESIEQYMNKLLQRVRGQSAGPAETQAQPAGAVAKMILNQPEKMTGRPAAASADELSVSTTNKFAWANYDAGRQKSSTPAPKTDLEALRALANETARRAISRHALRKHRRNALTKVIVSTLAGVTSLWMMLESPDWRTLQFNTACVALLVAAYWAGQTYRALLQALREKAIDDPEDELAETGTGLHSPLPIDVDKPSTKDDES